MLSMETTPPWKAIRNTDGTFDVKSEVTGQCICVGVSRDVATLVAQAPEMLRILSDNGMNLNRPVVQAAEGLRG